MESDLLFKKVISGETNDPKCHEMDLFPTFAKIAGGKVPQDRVIDGLDMTGFFLGKQERSGHVGPQSGAGPIGRACPIVKNTPAHQTGDTGSL